MLCVTDDNDIVHCRTSQGMVCWFGLGQGWVWRSGQVTIGGGRGPGTVAGGPP